MRESLDLGDQKVLMFVPAHNAPGKKDVTGAFLPEARKLASLTRTDSKLIAIDNTRSPAKRRQEVLAAFEAESDAYDSIAFFCHGWLDGIQFGFSRGTLAPLAEAIHAATNQSAAPVVPLFCCSTGQDARNKNLLAVGAGDGSFADRLRDALCAQGAIDCRVVAHTTAAHTTSNPNVLFMEGMGTPHGGTGGYPPVSRGSALWRPWSSALRDRLKNTLRLRMPYMTVADIHSELAPSGIA